MQTFKEIPFQNYIELKFNNKNLNELAQQEALLRYKRNAQLLAEIFTFDQKKREVFQSEDCITQGQVDELKRQMEEEERSNQQSLERMKESARKYEEMAASIKEIRSKEELFNIVDSLKSNGLYDDCHPYFVEDSPFYLAATEEDHLQVSKPQPMSEEGLSFIEIN